jgi:hypothetical protein
LRSKRTTGISGRLDARLLCMTLTEARATENEVRNDTEHLQRLVKPCVASGSKGAMCGN